MSSNFSFSSGASLSMRDQTVSGDTGCTTVTGSYNSNTTKIVDSYNTRTTNDYGRYFKNYYTQPRLTSSEQGYPTYPDAIPHTQYRSEIPNQAQNYEPFNGTPYHGPQHEYRGGANSNFGLPLGPGSPQVPPTNQLAFRPQALPEELTPYVTPNRGQQGQLYQSFTLLDQVEKRRSHAPHSVPYTPQSIPYTPPSVDGASHTPQSVADVLQINSLNPVQRLTPEASASHAVQEPERPYTPRSPHNPFAVRLASNASNTSSPAVCAQRGNFNFDTPLTEPGMISPLQLPTQ